MKQLLYSFDTYGGIPYAAQIRILNERQPIEKN